MTGGLIDILSGVTLLRNGGWQKGVWTSNLSSLNVGGTFDLWDGNSVRVDALTGAGTITKGMNSANPDLVVEVNGRIRRFFRRDQRRKRHQLLHAGQGRGGHPDPLRNDGQQLRRATVNAGTLILAKTNSATAHARSSLTIAGGTVQLGGTGGDQIYDNVVVAVNSGLFDLDTGLYHQVRA